MSGKTDLQHDVSYRVKQMAHGDKLLDVLRNRRLEPFDFGEGKAQYVDEFVKGEHIRLPDIPQLFPLMQNDISVSFAMAGKDKQLFVLCTNEVTKNTYIFKCTFAHMIHPCDVLWSTQSKKPIIDELMLLDPAYELTRSMKEDRESYGGYPLVFGVDMDDLQACKLEQALGGVAYPLVDWQIEYVPFLCNNVTLNRNRAYK